MNIQQIYTGCIAQAAYYLESDGEAAIFDPLREVQPYIDRAQQNGAKITYIFETHFHADFVSGHLDLAAKTGGKIVYGPTAKPQFEAIIAEDNQEFKVGRYTIKAIHTPGHTLESTCYLLFDENHKPHAIITGDTLFIGDVGRPDLAQTIATDLTQELLAGHLYDSLQNKIMPLPDDVIIFPSHGAGSACGKNLSKETTDTLGNQKRTNYALRADMSKAEFVDELLNGLAAPPAYFPQNVLMNIQGYESLDNVIEKSKRPISPTEFLQIAAQTGAIILDVRHETEFVVEHIKGSMFIGINGGFAPWVGALLMNVEQPILLVTPENKEEETITRLARVGFDNVLGYLDGGIATWKAAGFETDSIESISPDVFAQQAYSDDTEIVDARKPGEYASGHLEAAKNLPLDTILSNVEAFPKEKKTFIHCAGGYRSVIMASLLKARGIHNVVNVEKGMAGIKNTGLPIIQEAVSN